MAVIDRESTAARAGRREWLGLFVLSLAVVLYSMDLTVLHLAVPTISAELEPSSAQLLWIIDIYGFFVAGALITMGTIGDRVGRRRLLLIGAAGFGMFSTIAAFSPSAEVLILSRALMGLAGATIAPSTLSLIFNMFPDDRDRSTAIGVWVTAFSIGGALGPIVGGLLLEAFWWGSVFLMAIPVMGLLLLLGPRTLPEFRNPEAGRVDLVSAAFSLLAVLAVIYGLKETAQSGPGVTPAVAVVAGLVLANRFWRRQRRLAEPLINPELFRRAEFSTALAANVVAIFVAIGYFLFVAQYLQLVVGLTPIQAGLWSLPSALGFVAGSNTAPLFVHRLRPATVLGAAFTVAALGLLLLTQSIGGSQFAAVIVGTVIIGLALAPVFNLTTELVVGSAPPEKAGVASGLSETATELGGALGIAVLGSVATALYRSRIATGIPAHVPGEIADHLRDTLGAGIQAAQALPNGLRDAVIEIGRTAFVDGFHVAAILSAALAAATAVVVVAVMRSGRLDTPAGTDADSAAG